MADSTTAKPVKFKTILYLRLAADLIDGFKAENLLADKAYDCNSIIEKSILQGVKLHGASPVVSI